MPHWSSAIDHIYYNAVALIPSGSGVQTYTRELISAVADRTSLDLTARVQRRSVQLLPPTVATDEVADSSGVKRAIQGLKPLGRDRNHVDTLVHGVDVDLPLAGGHRRVATVHDLSVFDVPWTFNGIRSRGEQALLSFHLRRADALISVSAFTAERLYERFGLSSTVVHIAPSRTLPTPNADEIAAVRRQLSLPDDFVLFVGTIEPRKDVAGLSEACRRIGIPLVVAGHQQDKLPNSSGVRFLGYVEDRHLAPLVGAAVAVAYPSLYEGFGLPPLEALQAGTVTVATDVGALPEVLGNHGYPLVKAGSTDALTELLGDVVGDEALRMSMLSTGRQAVAKLSWDRTAEETMAVYEGATAGTLPGMGRRDRRG